MDLAINSWMHEKNCVDGMSFLVMAKEMGLPTAIVWAKKFGLKYKRPLALLRRLNEGEHDIEANERLRPKTEAHQHYAFKFVSRGQTFPALPEGFQIHNSVSFTLSASHRTLWPKHRRSPSGPIRFLWSGSHCGEPSVLG
jgi:hypothetical protein